MIDKVLSFLRGEYPARVKWEEVKKQILNTLSDTSAFIVACDNGAKIKVAESDLYLKVIAGDKTWYWSKGTGEFDGESFKWKQTNSQ